MIRTAGIVLLLAVASIGEGGASATSLLVQHALLALLGIVAALCGGVGGETFPARVVPPFAAFLALALAGALLASYGYAAWLVVVELAAFAFVARLSASVGGALLPRLALALGAIAALHAVWAIAQRAGGVLRPHAGFLNPNHLAAWLVAVLFVAGGAAAGRGRASRLVFGALAAIVAIPLVLIGSRAGAVGLVAGVIVLAVVGGRGSRGSSRRGLALVVGAVLLAGVLGVALRFRVADPFGASRIPIWRASLGAVGNDPWWGTKPGQFETASANLNFPVEGRPLRFERTFGTPHSDLLRAPCEFGLPATLALAMAAVAALASIRRQAASGLAPEKIGAVSALGALLAQGAFNDLTEAPAIYLLGAALLGAVLAEPAPAPKPRSRLLRLAAATALVVAFVVAELGPYRAWTIQTRLRRGALTAAERGRLESALRANPWHPDLPLRGVADALTRSSGWSPADYAAAREAAETAIRLHPEAASGWSALAHVEGSGCLSLFRDVDSRRRAEAAFVRAESLARHDPFIPLDAARFLLAAGDSGGARRHAERALAIEPNAVAPRLLLASILEAEGGDVAARAGALRVEAADLVRRFAAFPKESRYAQALLTLDAPAGGD